MDMTLVYRDAVIALSLHPPKCQPQFPSCPQASKLGARVSPRLEASYGVGMAGGEPRFMALARRLEASIIASVRCSGTPRAEALGGGQGIDA